MEEPETSFAALTIRLFGPMQVLVHGQPLPALRSRKVLWLLALLTLRQNRPVEREWLAATLWPDLDQPQAYANLRPLLTELRKALGSEAERLQSPNRHTLVLELMGADVDVHTFDAAIDNQNLQELASAAALYHGPLLEGCNEDWVFQERVVREQNCLQALQFLGDAALSGGDNSVAISYYRRAVSLDPWREEARRGWMEALSKSGDTNAAMGVYREFVEVLRADPKAIPDEKTSALYQRLRSDMHQRTSTHTAVPVEADLAPSVRGYLPHALTDLVGREDERMEVAVQVRRSRLVTLTGVGGIGKTRLAREVANDVVGEYPDGVWLVALEALSESRLVIPQVAAALGLREERERTPLQSVAEHLRAKRLLLVLDNCEHLLEASAHLIDHLLRECAQVRILATSREALGITGESVWMVPVLAVPDPKRLPQGHSALIRVLMGYESVQLFVERAQAAQRSFDLTPGNTRLVAQVCRQLEGIPLAIELAAARVRAMTVEQIAARLDDHLGLLTVGSRTAQARQQTLRATLDWSYNLLTEPERSLLRRLSVFAGGCTLEAAEQVCAGESIEKKHMQHLLISLVDKSLILFEERGALEGRYRLLEMVRQYAAEGLQAHGEAEPVKNRHRDCFLSLAEEAEPHLKGAEQANRLQRLETEHDNLRAALVHCETEALGAQKGLQLTGALHRFWDMRGDYHEGRAYLGRALKRAGAQEATAARAKTLNAAGALAHLQGDYEVAGALNEEAQGIQRELGDRTGLAVSLNNLGDLAYGKSDFNAARTLHEESLAISRELEDRAGIALSLFGLGRVAFGQADYNAAGALFEESLIIRRELGDRVAFALSLYSLASVAYSQGDHTTGRTLFEKSLAIRRELGDKGGIGLSLFGLGRMALDRADNDAARTLFGESLTIRRELGDKVGIAFSLYYLGRVARSDGDYDAARSVLQESVALFRETGNRYLIHAIGLQGHVERETGNYHRAGVFYHETLRLRLERGDLLATAQSLEDFAVLAGREGKYERAVLLLGAVETVCAPLGHTLSVAVPAEYERTAVAARATLTVEAFAAAWEAGRTMTLEQAIAYATESR